MTPEQAAVVEIERILRGADPAGVLAEAGTLALAWGVSVEDFQLALGCSGPTAPEESLREFLIALAGRTPEAAQTIANVGIRFDDPRTGNLLPMRSMGAMLNYYLKHFGKNVRMAILETIFGGGTPTALGLMALVEGEAA